ncbi:MAG: metallophosphoesterase family protein, partial [Chitinophagales bacterium]
MARWAISDIHGCCQTFIYMVEKELQITKEDELFLLGDYIDRGKDSKGVFDYIMQLQKEQFQVQCLMGNHEDMLIESFHNPLALSSWMRNGGAETLESFDAKAVTDIPTKYIDFIKNLKLYIELEDYWLVHAGFNFNHQNIFADREAMLWLRYWYSDIDLSVLGERTIVHGHTPIRKGIIEKNTSKTTPVIDIDAGCVYRKNGLGYLCALNLDTKEVVFLPNRDI